jgi:hypothetical protein
MPGEAHYVRPSLTSSAGGHGVGPGAPAADASVRELWRPLGPTAWMVLEELAVHADSDGQIAVGVRRLGSDLGLDKDTVARALRRLRGAGLVVRPAEGGYRLRVVTSHEAAIDLIPHAELGCPHDGDGNCCPAMGDSASPSHTGGQAAGVESTLASGSSVKARGCIPGPSAQPTLFDPSPTTFSR